ncbi:MAG: cytochrome P450 [Myxococcota bacterium]|nr:cytochrome P450 [Myxococcota bacterium]
MPNHPTRPEIRLLDGEFYANRPIEHYAWMRENAPVYHDEDAGVWGVARHQEVMTISKTPEIFCSAQSSRPEPNSWVPSMINMDDPEHKRRRNLVNRGFTPKRLRDSEAKARRICNRLIDAVCERGECEFVREIAAPLPLIMIGDMLGMPEEDFETLLRWSEDMLLATSTTASEEVVARAQQSAGEYFTYAAQAIEARRKEPTDDLVSVLVNSVVDGDRLEDDQIMHEALLILVGGDETTRHVITEGALALIEHPDQRRLLAENPGKLTVAVEELLRWVSPIKNMNRTALRDTELQGQKIHEGDKVLLLYHAANLDEAAFDAPGRFDVERRPNNHVAFGGYGTHHCLGSSLARLELRVMFEQILLRLPDLELASDAPLRLRPSNFIVGIEEMPVRFTPSKPEAQKAS